MPLQYHCGVTVNNYFMGINAAIQETDCTIIVNFKSHELDVDGDDEIKVTL